MEDHHQVELFHVSSHKNLIQKKILFLKEPAKKKKISQVLSISTGVGKTVVLKTIEVRITAFVILRK